MTMTPDNPDPLEVLAQLYEAAGNKAAAFTLRSTGAVGAVLEAQLAIIAQHYAPVIAENERLEALVGELGEALGRLCREADELDRAGLADAFDQADATLAKLEKTRG